MTTSELKQKIIEAKDPAWFNSISLDLNYKSIELNFKLNGFTAIYEYFHTQVNGWKNLDDKGPAVLRNSRSYFENIESELIKFLNRNHVHNSNTLNSNWIAITSLIQSNGQIFTYDCPEASFLINVNSHYPQYVSGAVNFLISDNNVNISTKEKLIGAFLAYEFLLKDHSKIVERRNTEKSSISKIRNDFQKYLSKSESQLLTHLTDANSKYEEYVKIIDELKTKKEELFDIWFKETQENNDKFFDDAEKNKNDLENTYRERLRLEGPADYWKKRAENLRRQAWKSTYWLIGVVAFSAISLFILLWLTPEGMLLSFIKDSALAIKWSIILVAFLSFLAYGIRILAKISFSAFHLARDAEEREQLTYLYLSLRKDGNVDEKDRQYVLQSLFSRAETGLLKDDSSPTMPGTGGIIDKIVTK